MKEGAPSTQEQQPVVRNRAEALLWVREKITHILNPEVISESIQQNPQVEASGELHNVDLEELNELRPVVGFQHVLNALEGLHAQAKESKTMPHEERLLTLIITRFKGNEQSAEADADLIGLDERFPGAADIARLLEQTSNSITRLGAANYEKSFSPEQAA